MEDFIKEYTPKKDDRARYMDITDKLCDVVVDSKEYVKKEGRLLTTRQKIVYLMQTAVVSLIAAEMLLEEGDEDDTVSRDS